MANEKVAHTPGPWSVAWVTSLRCEINAQSWSALAEVCGNRNFELAQEGRANARLIAAAPEMYDLLSNLRGRYGDVDALLAKIESA